MIFAARGLLVSLAFFAMVYCPLASLVALASWSMNRAARGSRFSSAIVSSANFLFGLRIFSFAISAVVAVFFTFPSFWLMERASLDEDAATFVLAACSLVILSAGLFRVLRAGENNARRDAVVVGTGENRQQGGHAGAECFEGRARAASGRCSKAQSDGLRHGRECAQRRRTASSGPARVRTRALLG